MTIEQETNLLALEDLKERSKNDVDRAILEMRIKFLRKGYETTGEKEEREITQEIKNTLF